MDSLNLEFVKDKSNILPFNLWSGSDYSKTIHADRVNNNWFACVGGLSRLESVEEYSTNGVRSIKCNFINANDYCEYHIYDFDETKSYTASFEVYSENNRVYLQFLAICSENRDLDVAKSVLAPAKTISKLTATLTKNELQQYHTEIKIRCLASNPAIVYVDNWEVFEVE